VSAACTCLQALLRALQQRDVRPARKAALAAACPACRLPAAGLERLTLCARQPPRSPLDMLTPLTRLTSLQLERSFLFWTSQPADPPAADADLPPWPADVSRLTRLQELLCEGFSAPSAHELSRLLAPLTQLTDLRADLVVGAGCGLPELPSLRCLYVDRLAGGGLALLNASCTALTELHTSKLICFGATDAAARFPTLASADIDIDAGCRAAILSDRFSLAACLPGLQQLQIQTAALDGTLLAPLLKGLSAVHMLTATEAVTSVGDWQALAALPSLHDLAVRVRLDRFDPVHRVQAFASCCARLTVLRLTLELHSNDLGRCVTFAAAMEGSCIERFVLTPKFESNALRPALPTPFYERLAAWSCLTSLEMEHWCTGEQLSVLCGSPTMAHICLAACRLRGRWTAPVGKVEKAWVDAHVEGLKKAHSAKKLRIHAFCYGSYAYE
jgi:hypothetical protein